LQKAAGLFGIGAFAAADDAGKCDEHTWCWLLGAGCSLFCAGSKCVE
jgi:hypothetical protein